MNTINLSVLEEILAICRLPAGEPIPSWALGSRFCSITCTHSELSIVCPQDRAPAEILADRNWRGLKVEGTLDFSLTGILAGISVVLAACEISIFALSTYDTDYILVKSDRLEEATQALANAGYPFRNQ
jgi:hypothetical protein